MKVYLDDIRDTPKGWVRTFTVADTIKLLQTGHVTELSLDHDLGDADPHHTGYDVLLWIENHLRLINDDHFVPNVIFLHTQNPVGKQRMEAAIISIEKFRNGLTYENT